MAQCGPATAATSHVPAARAHTATHSEPEHLEQAHTFAAMCHDLWRSSSGPCHPGKTLLT